MSMNNPNDFIQHGQNSQNSNDTSSTTPTKSDTLTVQAMDKARYGSKLIGLIKKHQKFLVLQAVLVLLIALSLVFW